ncbi:MAG TPA: GreA/GreB family elongation factor [Tenuifilaceae bacterium]|nr:GreA/GreB family elongation factor [Tenuifilaceae bacterium]
MIDMTSKGKGNQEIVTLTVTEVDYMRLTNLIQTLRGNKSVDKIYLDYLELELQKASKVDSKLITPDFVTMNSIVHISFLGTNKTMELRLAYPRNANFSEGSISILSPLGCALLGYKSGDVVSFKVPKGEQQVKIEKVIYQPEANGEDLV